MVFFPLREKCPNTEIFPVRIFPHLDWIRRFTVNLRIQSKYRKIRTRNNSVLGHFSRSVLIIHMIHRLNNYLVRSSWYGQRNPHWREIIDVHSTFYLALQMSLYSIWILHNWICLYLFEGAALNLFSAAYCFWFLNWINRSLKHNILRFT